MGQSQRHHQHHAVNCLQDRDLCDEMDVASFPSIHLYTREGTMQRYRGPRKADRYSFGIVPSEDSFLSASCRNNLEGVEYNVNNLSNVDSLSMLLHQCTKPLVQGMTRRNEMELLNVSFPVLYPRSV
ncbi:hypothetical protein CPLU01_04749 [Colletotrichum plurivorum]|uniref:Uncharacterized protein n=1 Tax=Colletotrichum plurivorum TaxID=2175906 RepID=A0A8H6KNN2_9PEZI|nr:hypothetical protein CPLU01_04749 [Colletotrichum plurivorum]